MTFGLKSFWISSFGIVLQIPSVSLLLYLLFLLSLLFFILSLPAALSGVERV